MAQVTDVLTSQQRVDRHLDYLLREWQSVPRLAEEWVEWEDHDRFDFWIEWPIREGRLRDLQRWDKQGLLTATQRERYAELLGLITRYRPVLDELFAE